MFDRLKKALFVSAFAVALGACGGGSGGGGDTGGGGGGNDDGRDSPPTVSVSGQFTMPDETTPMAYATVYVPADVAVPTLSRSLTLGEDCAVPTEAYKVAVCADAEGRFMLNVSIDAAVLKAFKGSFKHKLSMDLSDGQDKDLGKIAFPADPEEGAPRIAVVTGMHDEIATVLARSGLAETFDLYNGEPWPILGFDHFKRLFDPGADGREKIFEYDIVFINCGADETYYVDVTSDSIRNTLRSYVEEGGRLYVTDRAYDFVEQPFPEFLDFARGEGVAPDQPEPLNDAEIGIEGLVLEAATILEPTLKNFLSELECGDENCLDADGNVRIEGFQENWAVLIRAHPDKDNEVTFWVEGEIASADEVGGETAADGQLPGRQGQGDLFLLPYLA